LVKLNIYDLHSSISGLHDFLQDVLDNGLYHVGVEVYGLEFMYAAGEHRPMGFLEALQGGGDTSSSVSSPQQSSRTPRSSSTSGIVWHPPKQHSFHAYKRTVDIGATELSMWKVFSVVTQMAPAWQQDGYHILQQNCVHFADAFCTALGCGPIPDIFFVGTRQAKDTPLHQKSNTTLYRKVSENFANAADAMSGILPFYKADAKAQEIRDQRSDPFQVSSDFPDSDEELGVLTAEETAHTHVLPQSLSLRIARHRPSENDVMERSLARHVTPDNGDDGEENVILEEVEQYSRVPATKAMRKGFAMYRSQPKALSSVHDVDELEIQDNFLAI